MQIVDASIQRSISRGAAAGLYQVCQRPANSLPRLAAAGTSGAFDAIKTNDALLRLRVNPATNAIECMQVPNALIGNIAAWGTLGWIPIHAGYTGIQPVLFLKGTKVICLWYVGVHQVDYKVSADQGATWGVLKSLATNSNNLPSAIEAFGFCQDAAGNEMIVWSFDTSTENFSSTSSFGHSEPHVPHPVAAFLGGACHVFDPGTSRVWNNSSGVWGAGYSVLSSPTEQAFIHLVNGRYFFYFTSGKIYVTSDLVTFQTPAHSALAMSSPIVYFSEGNYYTANGAIFVETNDVTVLANVISVEFNSKKLKATLQGSVPLPEHPRLLLSRGHADLPGEVAYTQSFHDLRSEVVDGNTVVFGGTMPRVTYFVQPPATYLSDFLCNTFGLFGHDFPALDADVPAYQFSDPTYTIKSNTTLTSLVPSTLKKLFLHGAPRVAGMTIRRPFTAETALASLLPHDLQVRRCQPYRLVTLHYIDDANDDHLTEATVNVGGYLSFIHSLGHFEGPLGELRTNAAHWYGAFTTPRYVLACRPLIGLEIGDTVAFTDENKITRRGYVLECRETYNRFGVAPQWSQAITLVDIV